MIKSIHLHSFGQFDELKLQFTSGVNLIYAENEGGKTTLFSALEAALLGFIPAGQNYPYFPWDGDELSLEMELMDGRKVQRKMRGSITGYLQEGEHLTHLANKPLEGISREYFRSFHLLQAEDLLDLEKTSMDQVIERHLESLYSGGGTSPQEMLKVLEERRNSLYKKRGRNYLLYDVEERLAAFEQEKMHYAHKEKLLEEKKAQLIPLKLEYSQLPKSEEAILYPHLISQLTRDDLERARVLEAEEKELNRRKEELSEKLEESSSLFSTEARTLHQKAYALFDKRRDIQEEVDELKQDQEELKERIYETLGIKSVDLEKLADLKPTIYKIALVSFILSLVAGGLGALFQKPAILSLLLPLLLVFYFSFQSWKKQLYEADLPGFFYSPKVMDQVHVLSQELRVEKEKEDRLQRKLEELLEEEKLFIEKEAEGTDSLEQLMELEEERSKVLSLLLEEKEQLKEKGQALVERWQDLGPSLGSYQQAGLDYLERDLTLFSHPSQVAKQREALASDIAKLQVEIEQLSKELEVKPQGKEELLEEKDLYLEQYNRSLFLSRLIEKGYAQYKEELLPKLLERTSAFLRWFSAGDYRGVMSSKEGELFLLKDEDIYPLRSSMSKGLRSQFYLALRLALVELVDSQMPMFFDEAFSNWDERRLLPTLEKLQELPRQQFIFTCKERDLRLFEEVLSVKAIHL